VLQDDVNVVAVGIILQVPDNQRLERLRHRRIIPFGPQPTRLELYYKSLPNRKRNRTESDQTRLLGRFPSVSAFLPTASPESICDQCPGDVAWSGSVRFVVRARRDLTPTVCGWQVGAETTTGGPDPCPPSRRRMTRRLPP